MDHSRLEPPCLPEDVPGQLLRSLTSPEQLREMDVPQLERLAEEIRRLILHTVSRTGGHLAPNLGVVELAIALHRTFRPPHDLIVWDVGHQCYPHKILTDRRDRFHTLRQHGGISGFPSPRESPYDPFATGHSSTSISACLGMAVASRLQGVRRKVVAVIGDGAMGAGMALEALNHAGHLQEDLLVVLNDNEYSISPNVGALSAYLSRLITSGPYTRLRRELLGLVRSSMGDRGYRLMRRLEEAVKATLVPGGLFEELGFRYIGPVPGHRLDALLRVLENLREQQGPFLLHVVTEKGKGYPPAERDPVRFHGTGPFELDTGRPRSDGALTYTQVFGQTLVELAQRDRRVVAITAGMTTGTGLEEFARCFPDRFFDVGIAEQHAVTFGAGLASQGMRPVVAIYSTFLQRAYDQVLHDVCLQRLPVVLAMDRAGIVGEDGPTHHGLFDLSYLRHLPNLVLMAPAHAEELRRMLRTALQLDVPVAIRYPRGAAEGRPQEGPPQPLEVGRAEVLRWGKDVCLLGIGSTVRSCLEAARLLEADGIRAAVVNARFVKPLDEGLILEMASSTGRLLTVEENVLAGGFGSAVLELLERHGVSGVRVRRLGIPDRFVEHGPQELLRRIYGLHPEAIREAARGMMG